jgi:hypothetical protein
MKYSKTNAPIADSDPRGDGKPADPQRPKNDPSADEPVKPAPIGYAFKGISFTLLGPDHPDFDEEF